MKILINLFKVLFILSVVVFLLSAIWWYWPERTPYIKSTNTSSIASLENIPIGGIEQCVLIRSEDITKPILLFLHGGPGMPLMYLAHNFQRPLEKDFIVVQWDRRGAGRTFVRNKPSSESINTRQLIDDAYDLIDTLRHRYNQRKIFLVGHSFGTLLGSIMVNERPELFKAYLSIGQVVDDKQAYRIQREFVLKQATLEGEEDIIQALKMDDRINLEDYLFRFGGELKNSKSFLPLIWTGLKAPEYTLPEAIAVGAGSTFSSSHMKYNVLSESIFQNYKSYDVPIYFFTGTSDFTTPHELITDYYNMIQAPKKEIVYFDNSAHFPFYEEPMKFCSEVKRVLLSN